MKNKKSFFIYGPCSIDTEANLEYIARNLKEMGVKYLRGGAFKPRTSPYTFKGLNYAGLKILKRVSKKYNLKSVSEILDVSYLKYFEENIDVIQLGARNMQNFTLLEEVGKLNKPIIIKRGFMSTIKELLYSIEYILQQGNDNIIICERGIRTFQQESRFSLDITSIFALKEKTNFPVIVDPSHSTGNANWIMNASFGVMAAGADGLMIETHQNPFVSLSDADQIISLEKLKKLHQKVIEIQKIL
ncbi:MAG: 3-deoxy-7-phosphoheptulonate synthase [Candidatus Mcinerneyibacterium aminivorans]|uniref:3-deoxy-7-phosphoheptulonate synthase n=1 Tax=Candidatus Mcinerneyibacterium aminivorans TaxID=2703815 RepID=A0A5D0MI68_9BACT|nr:MAG: 3-deoxy-7-phosphoheptulonate synthase [Candidatus Mcinerneyibacterium aminivorans]